MPFHYLQVRNYEVYRLLEEKVKAMMTALPLVQDLHHPAMRERHWMMLMKVRRGLMPAYAWNAVAGECSWQQSSLAGPILRNMGR
jgi:hypothetical protein